MLREDVNHSHFKKEKSSKLICEKSSSSKPSLLRFPPSKNTLHHQPKDLSLKTPADQNGTKVPLKQKISLHFQLEEDEESKNSGGKMEKNTRKKQISQESELVSTDEKLLKTPEKKKSKDGYDDDIESSLVTEEDSERNYKYQTLSDKMKEIKQVDYFAHKKVF